MAKKAITMESRGIRYHQVQKVIQAFIESDFKTATIKNVEWTEWSSQNVCYRSFSRAIKNLGYDDRIRVTFRNDGRIVLAMFPQN